MSLYLPTQLSPHFTLDEMTRTDIRPMQDVNREQAMAFLENGRRLANELAEPVRSILGCSIFIHSGFRCPQLNALVGGSPVSEHQAFNAFDFAGAEWNDDDLQAALRSLLNSKLRFHQLLIEHGCLHVSLPHENDVEGEVAFWQAGMKRIIRVGVSA